MAEQQTGLEGQATKLVLKRPAGGAKCPRVKKFSSLVSKASCKTLCQTTTKTLCLIEWKTLFKRMRKAINFVYLNEAK